MKAALNIVSFLITSTLFGQINDVDAFFNGKYDKEIIIKQHIRQVSVGIYINEHTSTLSFFEFDSSGLLTKQTVLDSSGNKLNDYLFTYNKHGDQVERKSIDYQLNKTHVTTFNKTYYDLQLIQETSSELPFVTTYVYDKEGKKIQSTLYLIPDTSISAKRISVYAYDAKGKLTDIQETYIENNDSIPVNSGKTQYIYNSAGKTTEVIREGKANYVLSYNADGLLKIKTTKLPEDLGNIHIIERYSYTSWE